MAKLSRRGKRFSSETKYVMYTFKIYIGYSAFIMIQICTNVLFFFWQDELIIDKLTSAQTRSRSQNRVFQVIFSSGASGRASARPSSASQCVYVGSILEPTCIKRLAFLSRYVRRVLSGCSRISSPVLFTHKDFMNLSVLCYFSIRPASLILV